MSETVLVIASFPESIVAFRGQMILSMQKAGACVHVAAPLLLQIDESKNVLESLGVVIHEIPLERTGTGLLRDLGLFFHLCHLMWKIRPNVVLSYTIKPVIYGSLAAWTTRVSRKYALITGLGYFFTGSERSVLGSLVRRLYGYAVRKADKVFFQNDDDRFLFVEEGLLTADAQTVVVNGSGVDTDEFSETPLPDGPPHFLLISRLLGNKGVREFAGAARTICIKNPEVRFSLVGWIDDNPDAISQAELDAWISDGPIAFLGRLDDVRPAIADTSVYVLPSYREGTPRTVLEAMAMGRAVITTDAPGCRETVIDGENGFLVPTHSVNGLVAAMQKFIDDPNLARTMGKRSREIAEEKYDVHKVNAVMLREMGIT